MSAPTANNHSWFNAKDEGPGQRGFAHNTHLYNRTMPHHAGLPNDQAWQLQHQSQQPQYNWYPPASKSPLNPSHQMNSGTGVADSWNWTDANYQQQPPQYGQPFQQNPQQYSMAYRNPDIPPVARPNPDPWNWGWEEPGISAKPESLNISRNNNNNNACPESTWGWSIDSTAPYQEHNIPSTNTGYSSVQQGQNYPGAPTQASFNTGSNTTTIIPSTAAIIADSFSTASADQTPSFHGSQLHSASQNVESSFQNEGNKSPFTLNIVKNETANHPVINSVNQYATVGTASHFNQGIYSQGSHGAESDFKQGYVNNVNISQQETYRPGMGEEKIVESHVVTEELQNVGNVKQDSLQTDVVSSVDCVSRGEEFTNVPANKKTGKEEADSPASPFASYPPELSRESSSREQDISKYSCSTGIDGLSSQWSTESLPSSEELSQTVEGNEVDSSHSTVSQSLLATDALQQVQQQTDVYDQGHKTYEYSSREFNNDRQNRRTEEPHFFKDVSNNMSRNLGIQGYQSYCADSCAAEQGMDETAIEKEGMENRGHSQADANSNIYCQMSGDGSISTSSSNPYAHSDLDTTQPETLMNITHTSSDTIKTIFSVESVANVLETLTVSSNKNLRSPDVENKEIVYPEIEENSGATLPSHGSNVNVTPPPAVPGPPSKSTGIAQGKISNPYSLNHKRGNKYRASPPSVEGAAGGIDRRNYNHPPIPPVGPTEPGANVAQFGALPEIMSHTINNLMQPTYNPKIVETPGNYVNRKKKTPPPPTTEDEVNLETVPDNKERPDFIDVPQPLHLEKQAASPVARLHTAPVGQDAVRGSASLWNQPLSYSMSPENQEVAPRCGPDRNQYLETGQLTGDERDVRSSMPDVVETLQYRTPRNGNSSVSNEEFLPLLGLHRMVPGQITEQDANTNNYEPENAVNIHSENNFNEDVSTPPPGLHRMVPGQFTENENAITQVLDTTPTTENASDDVLLHRMVPGQLTEDGGGIFVSEDASVGIVPVHSSVDDIPPPGLRRMVPGESSSPESQGNAAQSGLPAGTFQPIDAVPLEPRVVTGVAQDEIDGVGSAGTLQLPPSPLSTSSRVKSEPASPTPDQTISGNNLPQPPSERSETIGSDSVEAYPPPLPPPSETTVRDPNGSRRDNVAKDRERRHRDEDGNDHNSQLQRRQTDGRDYYSPRDKDRAESPSINRYRDREEWDWKYDSRHERDRDRARDRDDSSSGGRYRDDRHYDPRKEYRSPDDSRRPRRKMSYDRQEDDADVEDYFSDDREKSRYHDNYDSRYRGRADTERGQHEIAEKSPRERQDHRNTGRDRERDHGRGRGRDRERRRQDYSDRHDYKRSDEYYSKGYEDDPYYRDSQRSRPSSRTEYEEYRRRDYHGYGAYNYFGRQMDSYHYDPYYSYKYYENLRRTNPAAYAEWYAKYYSPHANYNQGAFSEDRGSVHSGRSSANEELHKERGLEQTDSSLIEEATTPQRLTPAKFSTAHIKGILTARGQVVKVLPHYPLDGQPATVEIHDIQGLVTLDDTIKELQDFPGPLVRGVTHKNSVITFCMRKLKKAERDPDLFDRESVILLWKLLILLLRQNGTVVGADIAELLLSNSCSQETNVRQSASSPATSQHSSIHDVSLVHLSQTDEPNPHQSSYKSEEEITVEFREYLLYGNKKEALEWAMKHGLWGHALFLASKMDQRTYANVMMRFANGLAMNDPLQTLYQLMSGRQPAVVTCCADEKWGDWKPHLAMILSNPSQRPDLDHKAVVTLGDTLGARGCLHASHFCYLMAQLEFGVFSHKSSKIVLLGSSHLKPFLEFATNEAIQMTEIYIYACQLAEPEFNVPQFQAFKYLYAKRLAEFGMPAEAIHYVEVMAGSVLQQPTSYSASFIKEVYELGDQLKYHDPVYNSGEGEGIELSDPSWLHGLHSVIHNYNIGIIQQDIPSYSSTSNLSCSEGEPMQHGTTMETQDPLTSGIGWQQQQQQQQQELQHQHQSLYYQNQQTHQWTVQQPGQQGVEGPACQQQAEHSGDMGSNFQSTELSWTNAQWGTGSTNMTDGIAQDQEGSGQLQSAGDCYSNSATGSDTLASGHQPFNYWDISASHTEEVPRVTLPGTTSETTSQQESALTQSKPSLGTKSPAKQKQKEQASKSAGGTRSWLGGIWNKFSLRSTNQMKLPDDKNPSIVWDPDKKKWTNVDGDEGEGSSDLPPPPKASELPTIPKNMSAARSEGPTGSNVFKLNGAGKARKPKYVDVLGGSKTTNPSVPAPDLFPTVMASQTTVNYFIPAPVESSDASTDFLTPVASNTQEQAVEQTHGAAPYAAPMMFDPASFTQKAGIGKTSSTLKRYPN